jgi:hypothetical protein
MKFVFVSVNNNPVLHARENNTGCAPWQHFEKKSSLGRKIGHL